MAAVTDIPLTEPRWVKWSRSGRRQPKARKIIHHSIAYLVPGRRRTRQPGHAGPDQPATATIRQPAPQLMEWAIGKGYDLFTPDTGKLLLPGSKISWDMHIHAVGEEIPTGVEIGIWFYPKGQEPKHRSYLIGFTGIDRAEDARHPAELAWSRPKASPC